MNARFPPSEDATPFEVYYNASRVQLIMSGFMNSATNYAIRDIEICPNYCLDFENNCAATTEGSTDIVCSSLMFDQGSGERYGMLVPESTSAIDVQETSPTAQEVSTLANLTSSTTTLTSTAIASSTESSTMTKSSTAQDPSNSSINDNQSLGTAILGGIAALFATIIIIIILVYIVKKYRKKRIYKPQVRDFIHEEERIVSYYRGKILYLC